jgi:hypothetical protein
MIAVAASAASVNAFGCSSFDVSNQNKQPIIGIVS